MDINLLLNAEHAPSATFGDDGIIDGHPPREYRKSISISEFWDDYKVPLTRCFLAASARMPSSELSYDRETGTWSRNGEPLTPENLIHFECKITSGKSPDDGSNETSEALTRTYSFSAPPGLDDDRGGFISLITPQMEKQDLLRPHERVKRSAQHQTLYKAYKRNLSSHTNSDKTSGAKSRVCELGDPHGSVCKPPSDAIYHTLLMLMSHICSCSRWCTGEYPRSNIF